MLANRSHSSMNFDPSLPTDSRRDFVKKSLAASIIAAQPTILAGLIRAQGGGGGAGTTDPWGSTDPWATFDPYDTTGFETTSVETTIEETTFAPPPEGSIYKGVVTGWGGSPVASNPVEWDVFQIGLTKYTIELSYHVNPDPPAAPWSDTNYYTIFTARLKTFMAEDPEDGPFSGEVTASPATQTFARSDSRGFNVICDGDTGDLSESSAAGDLLAQSLRYEIGTEKYELSIMGISAGTTSGNNSPVLVTRDKCIARLDRIERVNGEGTKVEIVSVMTFKQYIGGYLGCYVKSQSALYPKP
jgi:hypothetical protein